MVLRVQDIRKPKGLKKKGKRVGRGIGSGKGKTSGKGHKGAKARSGGGVYNPGFEGGQMPMIRKMPKRGFTNKWKIGWNVVNTGNLEKCEAIADGSIVDKKTLISTRLVRKKALPVKVLGKGELKKAITVKADAFSQSAKELIEKCGGKAEVVRTTKKGS